MLAAGDDATCTITNTYGPPESPAKTYLTLTKLVVNTGGGQATATDWTLTAAAEGKTISGPGGVAKTEVPAGTYALSESDGVASYLQGDWICTGGSLTGSSLVLAAGDDASCTITNTYAPPQAQPAHLTLVKHVVNTGGGTAKATDWTLKAAGTITISGKTGDETVTNAAVPAGTYVLSESGGEDNYGASPWSCTAGTLTPAGLALAAGEDATCTITNTYESEDVGGATGTPTPSESVEGATSQPTATPPATSTTGGSSSNETGLNVGLFLCLAVGILGAILVQTQRRTVRRQSVRRR